MQKKVLVICHDTVGSKMAGPGIRYQNLAKQLSKVASVTLAVFAEPKSETKHSGIPTLATTGDSYKALFDEHTVIFAQWLSGEMLRYAKSNGKVVIIDLYAPVPIEYLASLGFSGKKIGAESDLEFSGILETYTQYLDQADYLVCSNERQRDFWLGFMTSSNILRPTNFATDSKIDKLGLCPMGISSKPPIAKSLTLRTRAGLKKDDFVMLWTGGIWDWFDAQVVIRAVKLVDDPRVKLVFMGTQHPNSSVYKDEMSESKAARMLSEKLGLTGKSVFFLDGWIDYDERASYLLDADVAIHADKDSVETRFSHRTRVLDNIWASLPTICAQGDYLSEVLGVEEMGLVVDERTPEVFAAAIKKARGNPVLLKEIKSNIAQHQPEFTWETFSKDLVSFVRSCKPGQPNQSTESLPAHHAQSKNYSRKAMRRVKNSIKVLLGRVDV